MSLFADQTNTCLQDLAGIGQNSGEKLPVIGYSRFFKQRLGEPYSNPAYSFGMALLANASFIDVHFGRGA
jgi:hypothetical protein